MTSLRQSGFIGNVVFAAAAGLAFRPTVTFVSEWMGSTTAAGVYVVLVAATYVALIAGTRSHALGAIAVVLGMGIASVVLAETLLPTALALTVAIAYARNRIVYRGRLGSPWRTELCIGVLALIAAEVVVSASLRGIALSVWAYWLVQSAYFLVPARGDGSRARAGTDPFDAAAARATDLMDGTP